MSKIIAFFVVPKQTIGQSKTVIDGQIAGILILKPLMHAIAKLLYIHSVGMPFIFNKKLVKLYYC